MNRYYFKLHDWEIKVHTEVPRYIQTLSTHLPYYFDGSFQKKKSKKNKTRRICFKIYERTEKEITSELDQKDLFQLKQHGICRIVNTKLGNISIFLNANRKILDTVIYHAGFLHPLFLNLLPFGATLMHASLVSKRNSGILILGQSGVGKSTLSVAFLNQGFTYFSDEHPIIALHNGKILGKSFKNRIGLTRLSANHFPTLKQSFRWNHYMDKFYLDPLKKNEPLFNTCSIDKILFPRFQRYGTFSIQKLKPHELFGELTQDDYFFMDTEDNFNNKLGHYHIQIMMELAKDRKGFAINYGPSDIAKLPAIVEKL